ncbi:MAG: hypothetical protein L0227_19780 [Chloroflexi bacterium]|nr:hypothetical protein [Chloroflexota bacterium]
MGFGIAAVAANAIGGVIYGSAGPLPLFLGCAVLAAVGAVVAHRAIPPTLAAARMAVRQEG